MALILNIETATSLCSVALAREGKTIAIRESSEEKTHAANLTVFVGEILQETGLSISDLNAVAVGKGPGSYTGLRIGVSVAKGICYGANVPLIAVNTLRIIHNQAISGSRDEDMIYCPMIDARRMEVFCCMLDRNGTEIEPTSARIIDENSFEFYLSNRKVAFFGSGMEKCRSVLKHPNAMFLQAIEPHASSLAILSEMSFQKMNFEDTAYFEPFYLKDFVATIPKKGLHF